MNRTEKDSEQLESILRRKMAQGAGASETAQCPEPNLLAAYYERALPVGETETLESHLADCSRCQLMLATIARADPGAAAAPGLGLARWLTGWRIAVPALAAAVVIVVVMQAIRPREAGLENLQIASLEKKPEKDKLTALPQMPAVPAAPAPSSIGALAMNEPKRAPAPEVGGGLGGELKREARAKTDTVAKTAPLAREKSAQLYSGAASGLRADVAGAPAAAPAAPSPSVAMMDQARTTAAHAAGAGSSLSVNAERAVTGAIPRPGSSEAWTIGAGGSIYLLDETGGLHRQSSGVATDLIAGSAPSRDACWVVGRAGTVLRTTDGGEHWVKTTAPTDGDLASVSADSATHAVVVAADASKFATSDGGATWQSQ